MTRSKSIFLRTAKKNMASSSRIILALGLVIILASSRFHLAETQTGSWTKDTGTRLAGGVPFVLELPDGTYRMYYGNRGGGIQSAISSDGLNWTEESGLRIADDGGGEYIVAGATVIQLDDGSYRMYYDGKTGLGGPGEVIDRIYSAISYDGLNWEKEGLRVDSVGTPDYGWASVAEIVRTFDGRYRLYYVGDADYIVSAISDDGLNFTREGIVSGLPARAHDPAVITFNNGTYWLFYARGSPNRERIYAARSTDGMNFTLDPGTIVVPGGTYDPVQAIDPAVILFADGTYRVYYWDASLFPSFVVSASWKPSNPSPGGFSLTLSNNESSLTIPSQGTLVQTYPLEISWPPNFLGNISISASWPGATPSGINYSLSSDQVTAHWKNLLSESLNLTVNIDPSAAEGDYSLRILGSSGGVTESTTQSIKLDKTPPTIGVPSRIPESDIQPNEEVKISVNVTDLVSGVKNVTLSYDLNDSALWIDLPIALNSTTDLYETTIPRQQAGTLVKYKIIAYDHAGNCKVDDNGGQYCVYTVIPEFPSSIILLLFILTILITTILLKRARSRTRARRRF